MSVEPEQEEKRSPADDPSLVEAERSPGFLVEIARMILETGPVAMPLRSLTKAFAALRHRDYRFLWIGALLSNIGSWIENVARAWLIYKLSGSEFWLGVDAFAGAVPTVLMLPLGGVLADRLDRRWIIVSGNAFLGLLSLTLAVLYGVGVLKFWHLIIASVFMGCWTAALVPANQSLLPQLVPPGDLANAVALNAMQFNISRVIGPAIGGAALVVLGATWSFGLNSASFLAIIAAVLMIRMPPMLAVRHAGVLSSFKGGAAYLRTRPDIKMMLALVFATGVAAAPILTMLPAFVKDIYTGGAEGYSMMLICFGIGSVIGTGAVAARSGRRATPWRAAPILMLFGALQACMAIRAPFEVALLLTIASGAAFVGGLNKLFIALLGSSPDSVRGRITSFHLLCFMLGFPIGSLLAGAISVHLGIARVFLIYGLLMTVMGGLSMVLVRRWDLQFQHDGHLAQVGDPH